MYERQSEALTKFYEDQNHREMDAVEAINRLGGRSEVRYEAERDANSFNLQDKLYHR